MLRCLAIDDEDLAFELLVDNISRVPYLQLVGSATDAMSALNIIQNEQVDLVFLDIQMPGLTGFQLIKSLANKPMFILVTAYDNYALEGYELDVVDYLLKPVSMERFIKACNKALELYQFKNKSAEASIPTGRSHFFVNADYKFLKIVFADIVWIEGYKDYVKIHLENSSNPVVTRMSMKSVEDELPASQFIRIQKSFIVSKEHITAIKKNSVYIDTLEFPVGELYKDAVYALVGKKPE
jgi:DNA-binding LytR/AlgR family response regulator